MARKYIAKKSFYWTGGSVGVGTEFVEGDPVVVKHPSLFRVEGEPDPKTEVIKAEVYVQPEQPKRRGRPPGSKNRPRG